jgi:D-threonate/D-erythronate kinase
VSRAARLLILADDFTGACDAAGAFGTSSKTRMVVGSAEDWPRDIEVLALDLDVRDGSASEACAAMESAAHLLASAAQTFIKIDSTLRGPIAALVDTALRLARAPIAVVAPAFPEQRRLLRNGRLVVDNSDIGVSLVDILGDPSPMVMTPTSVDDLDRAMVRAQRDGHRHLVIDADSVEDLRIVAAATLRHSDWLLVGSAGLARQLAPSALTPVRLPPLATDRPLLVVAGTPARATRAQLRRLDGVDDVIVLATDDSDTRDEGQSAGALARQVAEWAERHTPRAVVLTGGATASQVCKRLGARALDIRGELAPGIPVATFHQGRWHGLPVVTKAGGFGSPDTLLDVARALGVSS